MARSCLHILWLHSIARVASLHYARPRPISPSQPTDHPASYIAAAVMACAPASTVSMVLATALGAACNLAQSSVLGAITESSLSGRPAQVQWLLGLLMALWMMAPLLQALHTLARLYATQNIRIGVTDHLTTRLMHAAPSLLAQNAVGNLVERVELCASSLQSVVASVTETLVKLLSVSLLATWILLGVSPLVAAAAGVWMLSALLLSSYLAYTGMHIVEDASDTHAAVIANLAEIVCNVPLIRSFIAFDFERKRFRQSLDADLLACRRVRSYWVFVQLIETAYKWLFGLLIVIYAVIQFGHQRIDLPQLVTLCSLVIALSWHFESMAFHFVDLFDAYGVLRAGLRELTRLPAQWDDSKPPQNLPAPGRIVLANVYASYKGSTVLHGINLRIEAGTHLGIVGPSGAGKSSLLAVLRGDLHPDGGSVEVHGLPLTAHTGHSLLNACSEANQSALMFNRSILENLAYGDAQPNTPTDPGLVDWALSLAQASQLVQDLPAGLQTLVGERGASISTGERQRLAIARALLKPCCLLMLDEATSSVDAISEARILHHLLQDFPGRTLVVVSHRVAALAGFDQIAVMAAGRIIDLGTPGELLVRCPLYRDLLQRQDGHT